jgi:hypothetical protein
MATTISTNLDSAVATKARHIAHKENRSISNFVAGAVGVFSEFPKELRDVLLELRASEDKALLQEVAREMAAVIAWKRFDAASARVAQEARSDLGLASLSDIELLDAAVEMTKSN